MIYKIILAKLEASSQTTPLIQLWIEGVVDNFINFINRIYKFLDLNPGIPPHKVILKVGYILERNNKLESTKTMQRYKVQIINFKWKSNTQMLPSKLPFLLKPRMTINKTQGQTFKVAGVIKHNALRTSNYM